MSENTLTHRDLANALGVSETTIKSYRRKFPGCIPVANKGKPIRFKQEALEICFKIRDLFGTGMSVEEVSERLAADFPWCKGKQAPARGAKADSQKVQMELPQNFSTALSNLAKSMIAMRQQQTTILNGVQRLEGLLTGQGLNEIKSRSRDMVSQEKAFSGLVEKLEGLVRMAEAGIEENKNMSLRLAEDRNMFLMLAEKLVGHSGAAPASKTSTIPSTAAPGQEVPRMMLSYPLVVRDNDGSYMSAGGKSMGKVSLNDLKAMLAHAYHSPAGYAMRWEHKPDGWWVTLEQPELPNPASGRKAMLQVLEISSSKGVGVLEIKHYAFNGESRHPSDFSNFIANIGK